MSDQTQAAPPKSAKTVTVMCKMPGGMRLQLCKEYPDSEPVLGGGRRDIKTWRKFGPVYTVAGSAEPVGTPSSKLIVGGYAMTQNIPADFWEEWLKQNEDADYVVNRIIFAMPSRDAAEAKAEKEYAGVKSGLEPLDPSTKVTKDGRTIPADPRFPTSINPSLSDVQTDKAA